ncbi:MAG: GAF domain-containing protein [Desulfobacteraceae bacterium]|jgi:signal transduction histidine kinase|nr:GAF domain-containing protein [Desulfobacteraceae bacterium]
MAIQLTYETFYHVFRDISSVVGSSTSLHEVLDLVVWKVSETLGAKGAILRLLNLEKKELEISAASGFGLGYLDKGVVSSHEMITDLCRENKVIIIEDLFNDPRVRYPKQAWDEGIRIILDIPLFVGPQVAGIIRIYFGERRKFTSAEQDFLVAVAQQCSCAIDKARIIETQQTQYQELALQTEKLSALGRMAAGIAHEINNPLAGILLFSSNMRKKLDEGAPFSEGLDIIIHETIRCRRIIQGLLEFSREQEPQMAMAHINDVLEKTLNILENEFRIHRIRLRKDLSPDIPPTMLDSSQMEQVFVNLLINAVEAVESDGEVVIRSRKNPDGKDIMVEIEDNGVGINPEQMARIFEPFYSTKSKGTGLGLAVTYGILKKHGGNIRADHLPGKGACFTVTVPATEKPIDS